MPFSGCEKWVLIFNALYLHRRKEKISLRNFKICALYFEICPTFFWGCRKPAFPWQTKTDRIGEQFAEIYFFVKTGIKILPFRNDYIILHRITKRVSAVRLAPSESSRA